MKKNEFCRTWYLDTFGERLNKLYELREMASESAKVKIDWTIDIIESLAYAEEEFEVVKTQGLEARLAYEKRTLDRYSNFLEYVAPVALEEELPNRFRYTHYPKFSDDEYFGLIHDFYKACLDKELFGLFRGIYKKRGKLVHMTELRDSNFVPDSIYLPFYNETHLRLKRTFQIRELTNAVHEYGHAIQYMTNYHPEFFDENYLFSEVVSIFFEILSTDYFKSIKGFSKQAHDFQIGVFNSVRETSGNILIESDILELWESLKRAGFKYWVSALNEELMEAYDALDPSEINIEGLLDMNLSLEFIYVFAYLIAIELFMLYKKDPDLALHKLKCLMRIDLRLPRDKYFEEIEKLGIHPTESIPDFKSHIIRPKKTIFKV